MNSSKIHLSLFSLAAGCIDQVNGFVCSCRPGYEGELCDLDRRGCRSSPCLNGAVCQSEGGSSYSCLCSEGMLRDNLGNINVVSTFNTRKTEALLLQDINPIRIAD